MYDIKTNRSLLISRYGLDAHVYHTDNRYPTWEKSDVRKWLNSYFLNAAFTTAEQAAIATVTISTFSFNGHDGGPDTEDQIWLLSKDEASTYFANDDDRKAMPTSYAKANGAYESSYDRNCFWWLRSPGWFPESASIVTPDGSLAIRKEWEVVDNADVAVRPAFWLDLSSL